MGLVITAGSSGSKSVFLRLKMYFYVARNNKINGSRCQLGQGKNY